MTTTVRLRHIAQVNPGTPAFDRLNSDGELTFLPMEAVWPDHRLNISQRRVKTAVTTGYTRFQDRDVLVPKITPTFEAGRAVLIEGLLGGLGAGTTELHVLRAGADVDPRFLLYVVNTHSFLKLGQAEMYGVAGQQRVPDDFLRNFPVHLPSMQEQQRIVTFLDDQTAKIDRYVELHRALRKKLHEKQQGVTEALLLHGRIITDVAGSTQTHLPFPSSFPVGRLKNVAARIDVGIAEAATHAYSPTGTPLVRAMNIRPNRLDLNDLLHIEPWFANRNRSKYVQAGDILTVRTGQAAGVSAVVPQEMHHSQTFTQLITTPQHGVSAEYFCQFLNSRVGREYFELVSWGSAQPNISVPLLANTPVPLPAPGMQKLIASQVKANMESVSSLDNKISRACILAAERRQALITAAVTGQFDVSTASGRNVTDGVSV
ncbi:restriction endonuclease subunit S [Streptomyces iakyrus]